MLEWTADEAIYVSKFLKSQEPVSNNSHVVYNALSEHFLSKIDSSIEKNTDNFNVLMLCSLKKYKGVDEFVNLATLFPQIEFDLVLNASLKEIEDYFGNKKFSSNLNIYPKQKNVHPFYQKAKLVLNLSHPDLWVETFGMTALEAMAYRIPVIVPPVGGIAEIVTHNINGFHINCKDTNALVEKISKLSSVSEYYENISSAALEHAKKFNIREMQTAIIEISMLNESTQASKSEKKLNPILKD